MKRLGIILAIIIMLVWSIPAFAIGNPSQIAFGTGTTERYKAFTHVLESGDMLFAAEGFVYYSPTPTDYTASEAFLFQVMNPAANQTLASVPLVSFGDRPIGIYLTASEVTSLGLVSGTAYNLRLGGNPAIFTSSVNNTITRQLGAGDWIDQSTSGNATTSNHLRNFMIFVAQNMQAHDVPATSYLTISQGISYLSSNGGSLFLEGVPSLDTMCPQLFLYSTESLAGDKPSSTGSYAAVLTPTNQWGQTTANGLTALGLYLGINQALAGAFIATLLGFLLAIWVYRRLQSGVATLMLVATYPFIIAYLGLMPLALAFVIMIMVVALGGYYFFKAGAL